MEAQNITTKKSNKVYVKSILIVAVILVLTLIEAIKSGSYMDEVIGVISALYLLSSPKKIGRNDIITLILLMITVVIGLVGNILFSLIDSWFAIGVDIVSCTKLLMAFFALKYYLTDREKQEVIDMLNLPARLFVIATFITSILSQFVDLGMTYGTRFGLKAFIFIFDFAHQYTGVYMLVFGVIVCTTKISEKKKMYYYAMAIVALCLATKGPPILFSLMFIFFYPYFRRYKKINPVILIPLVVVMLWASTFQINEYLITESARNTLWKYSFKTANTYFPLGSGFATYGSDQAARHYSVLYIRYGFDNMWGLSRERPSFLNDNFWPMAIGQFGYFGAAIYAAIFVRVFISLSSTELEGHRKAFLYAAYIQYIIHAIGAAILSSSAGMIGFAVLSLFTVSSQTEYKGIDSIPRIRFKIK